MSYTVKIDGDVSVKEKPEKNKYKNDPDNGHVNLTKAEAESPRALAVGSSHSKLRTKLQKLTQKEISFASMMQTHFLQAITQ